ncbi:MAG TPA: fasciclin domain-containing protein [Salegentibacter sp.]|nr:fasciclin domain-containing protein [Salegentibacter sp.]
MKHLKLMGIFFLMLGTASFAQTSNPGGAGMQPGKTIVENASESQEHTTLVAAVKAAGLVETLQGDGPFTVFAPTNAAFEKLPAGTVETLLKPENKEKLQGILTYHVISGNYSADDIIAAINEGDGKAKFETVNGGWISAMIEDEKVKLQDAAGNVATVTMADLNQKNGVIHVIDTVVLPGN